jgi:hypothetical protein
MKQATHKWIDLDDLMISFGVREGQIPDDVWDSFVKDIRLKPIKKYLATNVGYVDVTSTQRKKVVEVLKGKNIPVVVVTDNSLVRGMVTAVSWLGVNIKSFSWLELEGAFSHLAIVQPQKQRAIEAIMRLRKECGVPPLPI